MTRGTHTTIETLSHKLLQRWVPKWYEAFSDPALGGFYERLDQSFQPLLTGQRRLVTQCRQLSIYSDAQLQGAGRAFDALAQRFDFILRSYYVPETGGWIFSCDDDGLPLDTGYDLYTLAFVIFAFSHYYQASGDERARKLAAGTLAFIDKNMRVSGRPGFIEALDQDLAPLPQVRRHESHMHLLEACLFAGDIFRSPAYGRMADELVDLFLNYFYDRERNVLSEYYSNDLQPQGRGGHIIAEPGHYCEWIWLLKKHAAGTGEPERYNKVCRALLDWASVKGWDPEYGGIYDELDPDGNIVADTKRIWPLSEALKANALMLDCVDDKSVLKERIKKMVRVLRACYVEERGFWTEWLRRDLSRETDYMPGTTPYHVYFGIMETRGVLHARGQPKSLVTGPLMALYRVRRRLSEWARILRLRLKASLLP